MSNKAQREANKKRNVQYASIIVTIIIVGGSLGIWFQPLLSKLINGTNIMDVPVVVDIVVVPTPDPVPVPEGLPALP
jgi:hypothetical protein